VEEKVIERFPNVEFGLFIGWILIAVFFVAYVIMLIFFPKNAVARLYDRSGQRKHQVLRRLFGVILVLLWFILVSLTPLMIGDVVFVIGISIYSLGLIGFVIALKNFGSLGFRVERPHMGVLRLGKSAIAFKVKVKTLE